MSVRQRGGRLFFDVTVTILAQTPDGAERQTQRFRHPVMAYVLPRLLPGDRPTLTRAEAQRHWEPRFHADCMKFATGVGPDPRLGLTTSTCATVSGLMDDWFTHVRTKGLRSEESIRTKMEFCRKWYGELPLSALELTKTHEDFIAYLATRGCALATRNRYIAAVIRPMAFWAAYRTPPLLKSVPFGKHRLTTASKGEAKRTRRCLIDEEARLLQAVDIMANESGTYQRLRDFIGALIDLGCRPVELLSVQNRDVDWTNGCINFPPETTKTGQARSIPFNPKGRVAAVLNRRRFLKPEAFVFGAEDGSMPGATGLKRGAEEFGAAAMGMFRAAWVSTVLVASGRTLTRLRSKGRLGASVFTADERAAYREVDLRLRDLRHEAASRWAEQGLKFQEIQYMLGHAGGITARYIQVLLGPLKESLAKTVWPHDGDANRVDVAASGTAGGQS